MPHDRRKLIDDLWALGLTNLVNMHAYDKWVGENSRLIGRNLQPWRAILAVAKWLEDCGLNDLYQRIEQVAVAYQSERPDLETSDLTVLVIRAICSLIKDKIQPSSTNLNNSNDISDMNDISDIMKAIPDNDWVFFSSRIAERTKRLANNEDLDFMDGEVSSRRVGRILGQLRLKKQRQAGTGHRQWKISWDDIEQLSSAYGLSLASVLGFDLLAKYPDTDYSSQSPLHLDVTNVTDVTDVTTEFDGLFEGEL